MTNNLFRETFVFKESQCAILSDRQAGIEIAKESLKYHRAKLDEFTTDHPKFLWTLSPYSAPKEPLVARLMAEAAEKAGVGPMAAVAGVLADLAVKDMVRGGCQIAVMENGGEVSAVSRVPIDVAVIAGDEPLSRRFGFRLKKFPVGLATSSGRFSHALSFGDAEAVTVFCKEAGLADAAATAVANKVKGTDAQKVIESALDLAKSIPGVEGVLVIFKGQVGTWGITPEIIKIDPEKF
jgi:ApbE superfamily uncharacterized protein (UPF0280 family)